MPSLSANIKNPTSAIQRLTLLAILASLLIGAVPSLGYFLAAYYRELGAIEAEAKGDSFYVSALASENPRLWQYQQIRLQDILDRRIRKDIKEFRSVLALDGKVIAESRDSLEPPLMQQTYPVLDAGRSVGMVAIKRSVRPILLKTALVALLSVSLGVVIFYLIRIMPIRSVQKAEEQSRRYAKDLEVTNADLRAFIFGIAHDLRAPLVNLKGFSSELRTDLAEIMPLLLRSLAALSAEERLRVATVLDQAVPEALGYIDSSTGKLDALVNAILSLSRIDFRALNPELVDTEALVQGALRNLALTIKEKNISVTMGPLPAVFADRLVMEQSIANLLDNACKYLEPGRPGVISITAESGKDETTFYFMDNGRGIAQDDLQKVFEIFRRAGIQDTPGEGMGLAFVKALVRRQGGKIWCESSPGEGSTFCLSIPANDGREFKGNS